MDEQETTIHLVLEKDPALGTLYYDMFLEKQQAQGSIDNANRTWGSKG